MLLSTGRVDSGGERQASDSRQQLSVSTTAPFGATSKYKERLEASCDTSNQAHQLRSKCCTSSLGSAPNASATGSLELSNPEIAMALGSTTAVLAIARIRETSSLTRQLPMTPIASSASRRPTDGFVRRAALTNHARDLGVADVEEQRRPVGIDE